MTRVLLLAGTAEARDLAARWPEGLDIVASLAGATADPIDYACETRIGGFGGIDGLSDYLMRERITAIIDATHPFATQISTNAVAAAGETETPFLALRRPAWKPEGKWTEFASMTEAANSLPPDTTVLLTSGRQEIAPFARRLDVRFLLRSIEDPGALPTHISSVRGRPPFLVEEEIALLREHGITHLVTKNAGGARPAKLVAAARENIPIVSIAMPPVPHGAVATTVQEALDWLTAEGFVPCTSPN